MNIYDFDDTIYDGESALDFFLAYIKVHPSMCTLLPKVLLGIVKYKLGKVTIEKMMSDYAPIIKRVVSESTDTRQFVIDFWDKNIKKIKPFYEQVRKPDDIILTASPELTIKEVADRIGIKNIVCTKIDEKTGDITRLCMRENKIHALKEDFGDVEIDDFYTDSIKNDGFFAEHAKRVFLVKGNKITQIK